MPTVPCATPQIELSSQYDSHDLTLFAAMDTIGIIADRLEAIVGTDRRMTVLRAYRPSPDATSNDLSLDRVNVETGLTLEDRQTLREPVERLAQSAPYGYGIFFNLSNGFTSGFGVSAYERQAPTQAAVAARYRRAMDHTTDMRRITSPHNVTRVVMQGWPGSPSYDDRIKIEDWNDNGVCQDTLIVFERPPRRRYDD